MPKGANGGLRQVKSLQTNATHGVIQFLQQQTDLCFRLIITLRHCGHLPFLGWSSVVRGLGSNGVDVAAQALELGTLDGRAAEQAAIAFGREVLPVAGLHVQEVVGGPKLADVGGPCKTVVGTGLLATVAAVDAVAHERGGA